MQTEHQQNKNAEHTKNNRNNKKKIGDDTMTTMSQHPAEIPNRKSQQTIPYKVEETTKEIIAKSSITRKRIHKEYNRHNPNDMYEPDDDHDW